MLACCDDIKCQFVIISVKPLNRHSKYFGAIRFWIRSIFTTKYFTVCSDDQRLGAVRDGSSNTAGNQKGLSIKCKIIAVLEENSSEQQKQSKCCETSKNFGAVD